MATLIRLGVCQCLSSRSPLRGVISGKYTPQYTSLIRRVSRPLARRRRCYERRDAQRLRALLVEDEFLVALHVGGLLKELGYDVVGPASRLSDGLKRAETEKSLDLGVLEINLAGEMSWPIARLLKEKSVPVIFVSGYSIPLANLPGDLADAPLCTKPASRTDLQRAIATAAAERSA